MRCAADSDGWLDADVLVADDRADTGAARALRALRGDPRTDAKPLLLVRGADA